MTARRILACRLDNAGDVLLTGPAVRALAADAEVVMWCGPSGEPAARLLPGVRHVLTAACPWIAPEPPPVELATLLDLVGRLRALDVDEAVVFTSFHQSPLPTALVLRAAGVPRIGATSVDYPGSLLDVRHHVDDDRHEVVRNLSLVEAMGHRPPADPSLQIRLDRADPAIPVRHVVLHPGASVPARQWSVDGYADVARQLSVDGWGVVVTGGRAERAQTAAVAAAAGGAGIDLGGATTFEELARVVADAAVLVTGNTGPAHLAAAVGTPVVSLFAPTVPASRWRPWRVPHVLLGDQAIGCAGCRARTCPLEGHPCLADVEPADVVDAVHSLEPAPSPVRVPVLEVVS